MDERKASGWNSRLFLPTTASHFWNAVCSSHFLSVACMPVPVWFLVLTASPASLALFSCRHCYRCVYHLCHSNLFWDSLWAWNSKGSKTFAKCTHVKCSLLMIGLTSDQTESIEALGKYIWEEKLRVLELAITLHLAKSLFFSSLHLHFWEENGQFWIWRQVLYQHLRKLARHATCIWPGFISLFCTMYWMQMVCKQLLSSQGFCTLHLFLS